MRRVLLILCLLILAPAWAGATPLRLAYLKHGVLYTLAIDRTGRPIKGAKPVRIRPVPDCDGLVGSPDERYVAATVDTGVELISLTTHKIVRWPDPAGDPSFSPNGRQMALDIVKDDYPDLCILDIATGHIRTLRHKAFEPFWSANGREIGVVEQPDKTDFSGYGLILNARTGKVDFKTDTAVNPEDPILSPTGRYLAVLNHLSRPLTGHQIIDRKSGYDIGVDSYAPGWSADPVLDAWSPNGKWLLWEWRFTAPNNDGWWLWQDIGLTSFSGRTKRKIGQGLDACFSPDSRHVLWLEPKRKEDWAKPPYDLMWRSFRGKARRLVAGVDAYTLVGAYSASRWL